MAEPCSDARVALRRLLDAHRHGLLDPILHVHGIQLLVVTGSVLDPDATPADLDLAVDHDGTLDVLALMEELYQLTGYERLDILDLPCAGIVARGEALGHGRLVYEHSPGLFAERQVVALAMMWDTRWLRDIELEQLAT